MQMCFIMKLEDLDKKQLISIIDTLIVSNFLIDSYSNDRVLKYGIRKIIVHDTHDENLNYSESKDRFIDEIVKLESE